MNDESLRAKCVALSAGMYPLSRTCRRLGKSLKLFAWYPPALSTQRTETLKESHLMTESHVITENFPKCRSGHELSYLT